MSVFAGPAWWRKGGLVEEGGGPLVYNRMLDRDSCGLAAVRSSTAASRRDLKREIHRS